MQTSSSYKKQEIFLQITKVLNFFNISDNSIVFDDDFNVFLIKINPKQGFDNDFCVSLEVVLHAFLPKDVFLKVDFNEIFSKNLSLIKDEIHAAINQAKYYNQPIGLVSKNAFERRLKHLYIDNVYGVRHESVGLGENRKLVIYPD